MRTAPRSVQFGLGVLTLLIGASGADAATITAATCSHADVSAAITKSAHGDQVNIPAGDCTWTSQLTIVKGISLIGAGQGLTVLRDNVPKDGSGTSRLLMFTVDEPNTFRLGGLTIIGQAADSSVYNQGHIFVAGTSKKWRIHHITMSAQTVGIRIDGFTWGLIDNFTFTASFKQAVFVSHSRWGGHAYGDGSWAEPLYWGTEKAIYIEDSTFTNTSSVPSQFIDAVDGGRVVFRYNTAKNGNLGSHGADSSGRRRGVRSMEIYNNTFTSSLTLDFFVWIRGGTGVVFNNKVDVGWMNSMVKLFNCRDGAICNSTGSFAPWGACNGSSPYDQNSLASGYRCVDQPGSGTSHLLSGAIPLAQWVGNQLDPVYVWNNTRSGTMTHTVAASQNVQAGRDYFVGTPRPGYQPYTYPHPLASGTALPVAPTAPVAPMSLRILP